MLECFHRQPYLLIPTIGFFSDTLFVTLSLFTAIDFNRRKEIPPTRVNKSISPETNSSGFEIYHQCARNNVEIFKLTNIGANACPIVSLLGHRSLYVSNKAWKFSRLIFNTTVPIKSVLIRSATCFGKLQWSITN